MATTNRPQFKLGTVAEGTLRTEDLLEALADELRTLMLDANHPHFIHSPWGRPSDHPHVSLLRAVYRIKYVSHDMEYNESDGFEYCQACGWSENDVEWLCASSGDPSFWESVARDYVDNLQDALQEYCPPFVYFGTHPGDGADFGFWPDMDALSEALYCYRRDHGGHRRSTEEDMVAPIVDEGRFVLVEMGVIVQVNDHGNVTVMDMDRNELWSVV